MDDYTLEELSRVQAAADGPYVEFIRSDSMSAGLYVLEPDGIDHQSPHFEDEMYVVLAGKSRFTAANSTRDVNPGDVIFVAAGVPHRFHDITEQLKVVVVFAPPETR